MTLQSNQFQLVDAGVSYRGESWGVAWGDVNNDGLPDLWANHHQEPFGTLYVNQGAGQFQDQTREYFPVIRRRADFHGAAWADVDNDGDQDLIQLSGGGPGRDDIPEDEVLPSLYEYLFINTNGQLIERTENFFGVDYARGRGWNPLWFDFDNDGRLDIFYSGFANPSSAFPATLFRQTNNGFRNIGRRIGIDGFLGANNFAMVADFDGDGRAELVVRTRDETPLKIYGTTTEPFQDLTQQILPNLTFDSAVQDIAIADFDGDLRPDVFVLTRNGQDSLLLNRRGRLVDRSQEAGLGARRTRGKSVASGDFDNDGDLDLFVVTSGNSRQDGRRVNTPDILLENQGDGRFRTVQNAGGATGTDLGVGDAVTTVDFDRDGFLDVYVTNGDLRATPNGYRNAPYQLFQNRGNNNRWIEIELKGTRSNRDGIGATVTITSQGKQQVRYQDGAIHSRVQNDTVLHFGLGSSRRVNQIQVDWSSGLRQISQNIASNQLLNLTEGVGTRRSDVLLGSLGDDMLVGRNGDDRLLGKRGDDLLHGGAGQDLLSGGAGQDRFLFRRPSEGGDRIRGFSARHDRILISRDGFNLEGQLGLLDPAQFRAGVARDANDRFLYQSGSGDLLFDPDGNGRRAPIHLATFPNFSAGLTAANIEIVA